MYYPNNDGEVGAMRYKSYGAELYIIFNFTGSNRVVN
jgi:hypothetical protein